MKEKDKVGLICLVGLCATAILYWESNLSLLVSTILMVFIMFPLGIITSKYQKKLKMEVKE